MVVTNIVMKGISELTKQEVEFDIEKIKYFGVEVYESTTKKGKFSSFKKRNYIKTTEKIYVDLKIAEIRKLFSKVVLIDKKEHLKRKGNKISKAISKIYEVVKENEIFLPQAVFEILVDCNSRQCLFSYQKITYYFIIDHIYRNTETEDYVYIDSINEVLIKTGFNALENKPSKYDILDWIQNQG